MQEADQHIGVRTGGTLQGLVRRLKRSRTTVWTEDTAFVPQMVLWTLPLQVAIIAIGPVLALLAVVPLDLQQRLIDSVIPSGDLQAILAISAIYAAAVVASNGLKFAVTYLRGWIQQIVVRLLRIALLDAQRRRTLEEADARLGAVTSAITGELDDLGGFASEMINTPLIEGGTLISLFGFAFFAEPRMAAVGVAALALQGVLTPWVQARINRLTRKRITSLRRAGLSLIEAARPGERQEFVPVAHTIRRVYRLQLRMNAMKAALKLANNLIMHLARIAIFCYGGWLVIEGQASLGLIVAFLSGLGQVDEHWGELLDFYRRFTDARVKYRLVASALEVGSDLNSTAGSASS